MASEGAVCGQRFQAQPTDKTSASGAYRTAKGHPILRGLQRPALSDKRYKIHNPVRHVEDLMQKLLGASWGGIPVR